MVSTFKENSLFLNENVENKLVNCIKEKLNIQNVAGYYQTFNAFNQPRLETFIFHYIERCFAMVCKTDGFIELNFASVSKILASSELFLTSEIQVYNAACAWVDFNCKERREFVKDLLLKVRMPLLTDGDFATLQDSADKSPLLSPFEKSENLLSVINGILYDKENFYKEKSSIYHTNRYNSQDTFDFLFLGLPQNENEKDAKHVKRFDAQNFKSAEHFALYNPEAHMTDAAFVNGSLYAFHSNACFLNEDNLNVLVVEKYEGNADGLWMWAPMDDIVYVYRFFRVCVFMDRIFVMGGLSEAFQAASSEVFALDTGRSEWIPSSEISRMKEARAQPACAVFQGRIVVSGGFNLHEPGALLRSVEAYDQSRDSWSSMPKMIAPRQNHSLVAVKNKLFVVGGNVKECEVFEARSSNKFVSIKRSLKHFDFYAAPDTAVSVGSKIIVFGDRSQKLAVYDVDKDEWHEESFQFTERSKGCICLKVPKMSYKQ